VVICLCRYIGRKNKKGGGGGSKVCGVSAGAAHSHWKGGNGRLGNGGLRGGGGACWGGGGGIRARGDFFGQPQKRPQSTPVAAAELGPHVTQTQRSCCMQREMWCSCCL
jgi:hypothetical protein